MSWALFHTPQSSVQLSHNPGVMNDTKQEWFCYLCLIIRNLKLVFQREIDSETLLCPTEWIWANVGNLSSCQDSFSIIYRNTLKSLVLLTARGSHGPQPFSGWKYPPPHRGLAMVNVKRAIFLPLFWDLFTEFHTKFILTRGLFLLLASPPKRFRQCLIPALLLFMYLACYITFWNKTQEATNLSHIISAHDYSQ